jgi:hypothetical protein
MALSITALYHYAECCYAECRVWLIAMLNVIMLSVVILNVGVPVRPSLPLDHAHIKLYEYASASRYRVVNNNDYKTTASATHVEFFEEYVPLSFVMQTLSVSLRDKDCRDPWKKFTKKLQKNLQKFAKKLQKNLHKFARYNRNFFFSILPPDTVSLSMKKFIWPESRQELKNFLGP